MTKILWVVADKLGCGTYRGYVPALGLKERGLADSDFTFHKDVVMSRAPLNLDGVKVAVFQRPAYRNFPGLMAQCRREGVAVLIELDDDLWNIPRHNPAYRWWEGKAIRKMLAGMLEAADGILVSTKPLAEQVRVQMGWKDQRKIYVCHNHIHEAIWGRQVWGPVEPYQNQHLVIGWQGSQTHDVDFKEALMGLRSIVDEYPNVLVRFLGCVPYSVKGRIPENRFQWSKGVSFERYPALLRYVNFDIGLAPVTDCVFNRSKSHVKWLEYSALGIPTVASRVYPYERAIDHGRTGFLAGSTREWYTHLKALVESATLRQQVGLAAQEEVWRHWSSPQHVTSWATAIGEVVSWPTARAAS